MAESATSVSQPAATATTRHLLILGIIAGPFYLALGLAQALVREGFDLSRHPLSVLANGPGGWIQTLNFVVTGLLVIGAAIAINRALRLESRATGWAVAIFGVSMLVAAGFPADPVDGFPPGTPSGVPDSMSATGLVHFAGSALGFITLAVGCFLAGRALSERGASSVAWGSHAAGVVIIAGFIAPAVLPASGATAGIWLSVLVGFTWLAVVSAYTRQTLLRSGGSSR